MFNVAFVYWKIYRRINLSIHWWWLYWCCRSIVIVWITKLKLANAIWIKLNKYIVLYWIDMVIVLQWLVRRLYKLLSLDLTFACAKTGTILTWCCLWQTNTMIHRCIVFAQADPTNGVCQSQTHTAFALLHFFNNKYMKRFAVLCSSKTLTKYFISTKSLL